MAPEHMTLTTLSRKNSILLIDQDLASADSYRTCVDGDSFRIEHTPDYQIGFELALKCMPAVISIAAGEKLYDDLFGLIKVIREDKRLKNSIVLFLPDPSAPRSLIEKAISAGASDYVFKGDYKLFLNKIKFYIGHALLVEEHEDTVFRLESALGIEKKLNEKLEKTQKIVSKKNDRLNNSLKQIALLVEDLDNLEAQRASFVEEREENFKNVSDLLLSLIENKQQYNRGHSRRVSEISVGVARLMSVPEVDIPDIQIAALLHEIGKISIPEELALKKNGEYTRQEKDLLAQHPVKGAEMLRDLQDFENAALIIKSIHERVDGTGIPYGWKRERIPTGARIIAAANLYDRVSWHSEMSLHEVMGVLENEIGSGLDTQVVNSLYSYLNSQLDDEKDSSLEVGIFDLRPGMTLATGIYTSSGSMLLPAGTVLTEDSIGKMAQYSRLDPLEHTVFIKE